MGLAPLLWILTAVLVVFTAIAFAMRARLASTPVTTPAGAPAPSDSKVMVGGIARPVDGARPAPLSGEPVLLGIGTRVEQYYEQNRDNSGTTRREERRPAGRTDTRFALMDEQVQGPWVMLDSTLVSKLTTQARTVPGVGMHSGMSIGPVSFGGSRDVRYEEQVVRDGDRLWATGTLDRHTDGTVYFTGRVTLSDRTPERQLRGRTQAVIGFGIVAGVLAIFALLASAGVIGG